MKKTSDKQLSDPVFLIGSGIIVGLVLVYALVLLVDALLANPLVFGIIMLGVVGLLVFSRPKDPTCPKCGKYKFACSECHK